jgi:hypothetical protein
MDAELFGKDKWSAEITLADEKPAGTEFMQVLGGARVRHAGLPWRISPKLSFQAC